ncbi:hypothetical protein BJY04DRAFT_217378 [Aspergillus karnatakaensis]|uniref:BTB/POZ domain-containing protein n=1 Tax=Aspergillus karnatakaensis TaxID=1810916 RepID=UPI003CCCC924
MEDMDEMNDNPAPNSPPADEEMTEYSPVHSSDEEEEEEPAPMHDEFFDWEDDIDEALISPEALRAVTIRLMHRDYQPDPASIVMCSTFVQICDFGFLHSYQAFLPLFADQWQNWERALTQARETLAAWHFQDNHSYRFPHAFLEGFRRAARAGHNELANLLAREVIDPNFAQVTDRAIDRPLGSTRKDFGARMLLQAVLHSEVETSGVLARRHMPIEHLRAPIQMAVEKNKAHWLQLLIDNLISPKAEDQARIGAELGLQPNDERVLARLFQERAEIIGPPLRESLRKRWENVVRILFPMYVKFAACYPRSPTCQAAHILEPATDAMYHMLSRENCLSCLKGKLPARVHNAILRRLKYENENVAVPEVTLEADGQQFRVARDVLCFHSPAFREIDQSGGLQDRYRMDFGNAVSHRAMEDILRYMYSAEFECLWFGLNMPVEEALAHFRHVQVVAEKLRIDDLIARVNVYVQEVGRYENKP